MGIMVCYVAASLICIVSHIFVFVLIFISPVESARASESFVFCALRCIICVLHTFRGALLCTHICRCCVCTCVCVFSFSLSCERVLCATFPPYKICKTMQTLSLASKNFGPARKINFVLRCGTGISSAPDFRLHFWLLMLRQHCHRTGHYGVFRHYFSQFLF